MQQYENKVYSQQGEDGILEHIFNAIGTTNKVAVEFGVTANSLDSGGNESNSMNLLLQGWKTFWFDIDSMSNPPAGCTFTTAKLTPDNILDIFQNAGVPTEFDMLSVDVDGNDYHLREKLSIYNPRVCVMEYNGTFDGNTEYIMPRDDNYMWANFDRRFGASLLSLTQQADRLGYDLVYCEKRGVNAFYIRKDINPFPAKTSQDAYVRLFWA